MTRIRTAILCGFFALFVFACTNSRSNSVAHSPYDQRRETEAKIIEYMEASTEYWRTIDPVLQKYNLSKTHRGNLEALRNKMIIANALLRHMADGNLDFVTRVPTERFHTTDLKPTYEWLRKHCRKPDVAVYAGWYCVCKVTDDKGRELRIYPSVAHYFQNSTNLNNFESYLLFNYPGKSDGPRMHIIDTSSFERLAPTSRTR